MCRFGGSARQLRACQLNENYSARRILEQPPAVARFISEPRLPRRGPFRLHARIYERASLQSWGPSETQDRVAPAHCNSG